jgi:putative GTP pyrophosphokinase
MSVRFSEVEFNRLKNVLLLHEWGQQIFMTKLNILNQDLQVFQNISPVEHIKSRIKTPEAIAEKLHRLSLDVTADSAKEHLTDILGFRIICPFAKDIYTLVDILSSVPDWKVSMQKDYISNPKPSGYRSYHLIIDLPIYYSGKTEIIPIEVQIRTAAMDFWSTMEHQVRYKYRERIPQHLSDELIICAEKIAELDGRMLLIQEIISLLNEDGRVML